MGFMIVHLTLVAYNWGGNVRRALKQTNVENPTYWDLHTKNILNANRVTKLCTVIFSTCKILSNPTEYGFDLEAIEYEPEFYMML